MLLTVLAVVCENYPPLPSTHTHSHILQQPTEFAKQIDTVNLTLPELGVLVIWKWDANVASSDEKAEPSQSDDEIEVGSDNGSSGSFDVEDENEEDVQEAITHTLTFKVIGTKKEKVYQDILEKCRDALQSGKDVAVRVTPEPENLFDSRAIAFVCYMDGRWHRIGYVMHEILEDVH